jgi:GNAT superfamily N-acetyltransferase
MTEVAPLQSPVPLAREHECEAFDCGSEPLNVYLKQFAWINQKAGAARTYVATQGRHVVGYYTLAFGSVEHQQATTRVGRGLARHPIPVMVLARLAVDLSSQRQGLGKGLLKDALRRTLHAMEIAGLRAVAVRAKDESARAFYSKFGFEESPTDPLHLMLLSKDLRKIVTG